MNGGAWGALVCAAALLAWPPQAAVVRRRVRSVNGTGSGVRHEAVDGRRAWVLAAAAGAAAGLLVGGLGGLLTAAVVTVVGHRVLQRTASENPVIDGQALLRELPGACDLLAVCLGAGVPPAGALAAVGSAVPTPLGPVLRNVAALYGLGAHPRTAWADVPIELAALGRVLVRAGESGSAVVPALTSLAADGRAAERARTDAAVRRAGIWVLAPLGLCFLPAFLCLGVVPLILGIAGDVFG